MSKKQQTKTEPEQSVPVLPAGDDAKTKQAEAAPKETPAKETIAKKPTVKEPDPKKDRETKASLQTKSQTKSQTKTPGKEQVASKPAQVAKPGKTGVVLAILALLVALGALALSGYIGWRGKALEDNQLTFLTSQDQEQLQEQIARQQARLAETRQVISPLGQGLAEQQQRSERLLNRVDNLSRQVREISGASRDGWRLAEVEYLLRLANQRLLMTSDVGAAKSLLTNADAILLELDDYRLYPVREALAEDLAVLRAIPSFDQEGLYLRLDALAGQVYELELLHRGGPEESLSPGETVQEQGEPTPTTADRGWQEVALGMLEKTWDSFASLFRFTPNRKQSISPLLSPEEDSLVRQNLRLMLEQGKLGLLAREQTIYQNSLQQSKAWIESHFALSGEGAQAMIEEIDTLSGLTISPVLPSINRSLEALKEHQSEVLSVPTAQPQESLESVNPAEEEQL